MKQTNSTKADVKRTALGVLTALAAYLVLLALLSLLLVRGTVGEGAAGGCALLFACLSSLAGAAVAMRGAAKSAPASAACAAGFWIMVLLLGFLTNDTLDPARAGALALSSLAGGAGAYLLRGGKGKKAKRGRRSRK